MLPGYPALVHRPTRNHPRVSLFDHAGTLSLPVGLQSVENGLGRMVEGVFSRAFKSNVRPIEIGRRMVREIDANRTVDADGRRVVPNQFLIRLSSEDHRALADISDDLVIELENAAEAYCTDEGYRLRGPVVAVITEDPKLTKGRVVITSEIVQSRDVRSGIAPSRDDRDGRTTPSGRPTLILSDGRELALGSRPMVIGRLPECDITFDDSNLSRRHAEISMDDTRNRDTSIDDALIIDTGGDRPVARYILTDLGSTNGTKVNGSRISAPHALRSGDVITVGLYSITFEDR